MVESLTAARRAGADAVIGFVGDCLKRAGGDAAGERDSQENAGGPAESGYLLVGCRVFIGRKEGVPQPLHEEAIGDERPGEDEQILAVVRRAGETRKDRHRCEVENCGKGTRAYVDEGVPTEHRLKPSLRSSRECPGLACRGESP